MRGFPAKERFWLGSLLEGYANWQADGLENRCPKGLVGSSPTPSANRLLPGRSLPPIDVLGVLFDALDGFKTVVQVPDLPCLVDVIRRLIRTFADFLPTDGSATVFCRSNRFSERCSTQVRRAVGVHVRDPARSDSPEFVNGLSTSRGELDPLQPGSK